MQTVASTWDIRVVSAMNAASVIAYVPRWSSIEFSDQLSDYGSGKLVHNFKDPFFAQFETDNGMSLLTGPYALQVVRNGAAVFTFLIEDVQIERLPDMETVTVAGRGIGATLEWAIALPEGYSGQARVGAIDSSYPKLWDRDFLGYKWICRAATTTNLTASYSSGPMATYPGSGAYLYSTTNTSINTIGIDGITDLIVGDIILVKNQTTGAHNGVYYVADVGSVSTVWRLTRIGDADALGNLVVGNQAFITEGATNGYKIFYLSSNSGMTLQTQVGTNSLTFTSSTTGGINALSAFWTLFKEAQTGYEYATAPSEFGTQRTVAGRGGPSYAVSWPLYLDSVIDTNKGYLDSKGQIIQDAGRFTIPQGKHMGEVLKQVTDQTGLAWHFDPSGSVSFVVAPFSRNGVVNTVPFGVDRTSGSVALMFTLPSLTNSETRSSVTERRTVTYGSDQRGIDKVISTQKSTYGIRESWFENSSQDAPAIINFTTNAMRKIDGAKLSQIASFPERTGQTAWVDFYVGDKVLVETAIGTYAQQIIGAISASINDKNDQTIELTFGNIFPDIASDLTTEGGFGSNNASIIAGFTGQTPNVNLPAPISGETKTAVVGMSNRVTVTWDNAGSKAAQWEVAVFKEDPLITGFSLVRTGNLATGTKTSHGLATGDYINVYPSTAVATNNEFAVFNTPILNVTSGNIYYSNEGPNVTASVSASIAKVVEYNTIIVDGSQNTATIENLSSPAATYSYTVTPINELGIKSTNVLKNTFVASNSPFTVVGSSVRSANYVTGVSGWSITSGGAAEFNSITLPSSSAALDIGGDDVDSFHVDSTGNMWLGASIANKATAPFRVSNAGYLTANTGQFKGQLDVGSGNTSFHVDTAGNMWLGNASYASAPFRVSNAGAMTATSGTFSGAVNGATIDIGSGNTSFHVNTAGQIWSGNAAYASAPFRVNNDGTLIAASGTIGGSMTLSSSGTLTTGAGLGATTLGYNASWSGGRSGVFSDAGGQFASFTYGDISILLGGSGTIISSDGISYLGASFDYNDLTRFAFAINSSVYPNNIVIKANNAAQYPFYSYSDERTKTNIQPASDEYVDKLLNNVTIHEYNVVNFFDEDDLHIYPKQVGVIAQEINEIFDWLNPKPNLTPEQQIEYDKHPLGINYSSLVPVIILALQKIDSRIKDLEARLGA
jgi:hypothetical protein